LKVSHVTHTDAIVTDMSHNLKFVQAGINVLVAAQSMKSDHDPVIIYPRQPTKNFMGRTEILEMMKSSLLPEDGALEQ